jgi:hypothetical protein
MDKSRTYSARRAEETSDTQAFVAADSCVEAAIAFVESRPCEGDEVAVKVADAETGKGCTIRLEFDDAA